jgi:hypothetical protein
MEEGSATRNPDGLISPLEEGNASGGLTQRTKVPTLGLRRFHRETNPWIKRQEDDLSLVTALPGVRFSTGAGVEFREAWTPLSVDRARLASYRG